MNVVEVAGLALPPPLRSRRWSGRASIGGSTWAKFSCKYENTLVMRDSMHVYGPCPDFWLGDLWPSPREFWAMGRGPSASIITSFPPLQPAVLRSNVTQDWMGERTQVQPRSICHAGWGGDFEELTFERQSLQLKAYASSSSGSQRPNLGVLMCASLLTTLL